MKQSGDKQWEGKEEREYRFLRRPISQNRETFPLLNSRHRTALTRPSKMQNSQLPLELLSFNSRRPSTIPRSNVRNFSLLRFYFFRVVALGSQILRQIARYTMTIERFEGTVSKARGPVSKRKNKSRPTARIVFQGNFLRR